MARRYKSKREKGVLGEAADLFKEVRKFTHPIYKKHGLSGMIIVFGMVVELIIIILKNLFSPVTFWILVLGFGIAIVISGICQLKKHKII